MPALDDGFETRVVLRDVVNFRDRRVESGHDELEFWSRELVPSPVLLDREPGRRGEFAVELREHGGEVFPLLPERGNWVGLICCTLVEIGLARLAVDVVIPRNDDDPITGDPQELLQGLEEFACVLEFTP